jgi:hypothetical protein
MTLSSVYARTCQIPLPFRCRLSDKIIGKRSMCKRLSAAIGRFSDAETAFSLRTGNLPREVDHEDIAHPLADPGDAASRSARQHPKESLHDLPPPDPIINANLPRKSPSHHGCRRTTDPKKRPSSRASTSPVWFSRPGGQTMVEVALQSLVRELCTQARVIIL